jgi:hypothetical protein
MAIPSLGYMWCCNLYISNHYLFSYSWKLFYKCFIYQPNVFWLKKVIKIGLVLFIKENYNIQNNYQNSAICRVPSSLPRTIYRALDKTYFAECHTRHNIALGEECFCWELNTRYKTSHDKNGLSAKRRQLMSVNFTECSRQTLGKVTSLASVLGRHSTKNLFVECLLLTLGKLYIFPFFTKLFCGVFLQYIDLYVQFRKILKVFVVLIRFSLFN